jgi:hypothetical protein
MMVSSSAEDIRFSADGVTWSDSRSLKPGYWGSIAYVYSVKYVSGHYLVHTNTGVFFTKDSVIWGTRNFQANITNMGYAAYVDGSNALMMESCVFNGTTLTTSVQKMDTSIIRAPLYDPTTAQSYNFSLVIG